MDSPVIEVAIGLVLAFALVAGLSSVITELVARFLGLRARFLLLGLRELLDAEDVATVELQRAEQAFESFPAPPPAPGSDAGSSPTATGPADDQGAAPSPGNRSSVTEALLGAPIIRSQGMSGSVTSRPVTIEKPAGTRPRLAKVRVGSSRWLLGNPLRRLPSYIPARTFSAALFDLVLPDASGRTDLDLIRQRIDAIHGFESLTGPLRSLLKASGESVDQFRAAVEDWYDDHMDRVSGWYKRHVAKWSLAVGALLVVALNVNSIGIARTLYADEDVRTAVAAVASGSTRCEGLAGAELTGCLDSLADQLAEARKAGLPVGWAVVSHCLPEGTCQSFWERYGILARGAGWWDWHPLTVLLGWLLTIVALVPGARFWFDALGRLGSLRTTGPKPAAR
jgi:hypothetical protein